LGRHRPGCPPKIATPMGGASTSASRFSQARNHLSLRSWWLKNGIPKDPGMLVSSCQL
jgi:hypothetical protein